MPLKGVKIGFLPPYEKKKLKMPFGFFLRKLGLVINFILFYASMLPGVTILLYLHFVRGIWWPGITTQVHLFSFSPGSFGNLGLEINLISLSSGFSNKQSNPMCVCSRNLAAPNTDSSPYFRSGAPYHIFEMLYYRNFSLYRIMLEVNWSFLEGQKKLKIKTCVTKSMVFCNIGEKGFFFIVFVWLQ